MGPITAAWWRPEGLASRVEKWVAARRASAPLHP
jgi:hypothetical protein